MKTTQPTLDQWINQWKLDEYEIDTLIACEQSTKTGSSKNELLWKDKLVQSAKHHAREGVLI